MWKLTIDLKIKAIQKKKKKQKSGLVTGEAPTMKPPATGTELCLRSCVQRGQKKQREKSKFLNIIFKFTFKNNNQDGKKKLN